MLAWREGGVWLCAPTFLLLGVGMGDFAVGSCEDVLAVLGVGLMLLVVEEIASSLWRPWRGYGLVAEGGILRFAQNDRGFVTVRVGKGFTGGVGFFAYVGVVGGWHRG